MLTCSHYWASFKAKNKMQCLCCNFYIDESSFLHGPQPEGRHRLCASRKPQVLLLLILQNKSRERYSSLQERPFLLLASTEIAFEIARFVSWKEEKSSLNYPPKKCQVGNREHLCLFISSAPKQNSEILLLFVFF